MGSYRNTTPSNDCLPYENLRCARERCVRNFGKASSLAFPRSSPSLRSGRSWTDSNRRRRFCRPVPDHSATRPYRCHNIILFYSVYQISRLIFRIFIFIKYKAFILSLCVLVYLSELVAMPMSMERSCCEQSGKTQDHCPKPAKGCNTNQDCCTNCPFCYSMVIVSPGRLSHPTSLTKRSFSIFTATYSYLYYSSAWKPPNQA
jgi:hypothetical protein